MPLNEFINNLMEYKIGWAGPWHRFRINYENDYIRVLSIDNSNPAGAYSVENTKQWSIIVEIRRDFSRLPNWIRIVDRLGEDIKITPVNNGQYRGNYGIRFYNMARPPDINIINNFLGVLFE